MFSVVYTMVNFVLEEGDGGRINTKDTLVAYLQTLQDCLMTIVDQIYFDPQWWSSRVLAATISLFILFYVQGFLMNLIGANLVVNPTPAQIDDVSFFTNDSWTQPMILKKLFLIPLLKSSVPNSTMNHLWKVISNRPKELMFDVDMSKGHQVAFEAATNIMGMIAMWRRAFISPRRFQVGLLNSNNQSDYTCTNITPFFMILNNSNFYNSNVIPIVSISRRS